MLVLPSRQMSGSLACVGIIGAVLWATACSSSQPAPPPSTALNADDDAQQADDDRASADADADYKETGDATDDRRGDSRGDLPGSESDMEVEAPSCELEVVEPGGLQRDAQLDVRLIGDVDRLTIFGEDYSVNASVIKLPANPEGHYRANVEGPGGEATCEATTAGQAPSCALDAPATATDDAPIALVFRTFGRPTDALVDGVTVDPKGGRWRRTVKETMTFVGRVRNEHGQGRCTTTVEVAGRALDDQPLGCELFVSPAETIAGSKVNLDLKATGDVQEVRFAGKAFPANQREFQATVNRPQGFVMQVVGSGGATAQCSANVSVTGVQPPPRCTLTLRPARAVAGTQVAVEIQTSGDVEVMRLNGEEIAQANAELTMTAVREGPVTVEVAGAAGSSSCNAHLTVAEDAPGCRLTAHPTAVVLGDPVRLKLETNGQPSAANIAGEVVQPPLAEIIVRPPESKRYIGEVVIGGQTLQCAAEVAVAQDDCPEGACTGGEASGCDAGAGACAGASDGAAGGTGSGGSSGTGSGVNGSGGTGSGGTGSGGTGSGGTRSGVNGSGVNGSGVNGSGGSSDSGEVGDDGGGSGFEGDSTAGDLSSSGGVSAGSGLGDAAEGADAGDGVGDATLGGSGDAGGPGSGDPAPPDDAGPGGDEVAVTVTGQVRARLGDDEVGLAEVGVGLFADTDSDGAISAADRRIERVLTGPDGTFSFTERHLEQSHLVMVDRLSPPVFGRPLLEGSALLIDGTEPSPTADFLFGAEERTRTETDPFDPTRTSAFVLASRSHGSDLTVRVNQQTDPTVFVATLPGSSARLRGVTGDVFVAVHTDPGVGQDSGRTDIRIGRQREHERAVIVFGSSGPDQFRGGQFGADVFFGGGGDDGVVLYAGRDVAILGAGEDQLYGDTRRHIPRYVTGHGPAEQLVVADAASRLRDGASVRALVEEWVRGDAEFDARTQALTARLERLHAAVGSGLVAFVEDDGDVDSLDAGEGADWIVGYPEIQPEDSPPEDRRDVAGQQLALTSGSWRSPQPCVLRADRSRVARGEFVRLRVAPVAAADDVRIDGQPVRPGSGELLLPVLHTRTLRAAVRRPAGYVTCSVTIEVGGSGGEGRSSRDAGPCAEGVTEEDFGSGIVGCSGNVSFAERAQLCGSGYRVCRARVIASLAESVVAASSYWTDDALRYHVVDGVCTVHDDGRGQACAASSGPMRVCAPGSERCQITECRLRDSAGAGIFGGCSPPGHAGRAGTLCCPR